MRNMATRRPTRAVLRTYTKIDPKRGTAHVRIIDRRSGKDTKHTFGSPEDAASWMHKKFGPKKPTDNQSRGPLTEMLVQPKKKRKIYGCECGAWSLTRDVCSRPECPRQGQPMRSGIMKQ
jgi:hypothetical protein